MRIVLSVALLLFNCHSANAEPPVPPVANHPLLGAWTFTLPNSSCSETYAFHPDGTTLVTSGEEVAESTYEISNEPSEKGFYRWVDKIVKDNGKKDCSGETMILGDVSTEFVKLYRSGELFIVCRDESLNACWGPLRRVHEQGS